MFAYATFAQLALLQFPGAAVGPVTPPPTSRPNPGGVIVVVDVPLDLTYGTKPAIGQPFVVIINQPFVNTSVGLHDLSLVFTAPSGKVQAGDSRFVRIVERNVAELEQFSTPQSVTYTAATGEFNEPGVWQVNVHSGLAISANYFFTVTNA